MKQAWLDFTQLVWQAAAECLEQKCKEAAAPHRQTGRMEDDSEITLFTANDSEVSGSLAFTAPYASFVDTGRGEVVPVVAKVLRFSVGGSTVFAMHAAAYEGSEWFTGTCTDSNWQECVERAASETSVFA